MFVQVVLPEVRDADGKVTQAEKVITQSEKPEYLTDGEAKLVNILNRPKVREATKDMDDVSKLEVRVYKVPFQDAK
jgi:hypothetical protein